MIHPERAEDPRALVASDRVAAVVAAAPSFAPRHRGNAVFRWLMRDVIARVAFAEARGRAAKVARIEADLASARRWRDQLFRAWVERREAVARAVGGR